MGSRTLKIGSRLLGLYFRRSLVVRVLGFSFGPALIVMGAVWLGACAAAPVKLECQQHRLRLDYEVMNEDQKRYTEELFSECETRLDSAQAKDSATIENLNNRFTPQE